MSSSEFENIQEWMRQLIDERLEEFFSSEDEFNSINRLHDKLNSLLNERNRQDAVLLAEKTLDKFEEYMKNVDKLNAMINEFKGCVTLARSAIAERKKEDNDLRSRLLRFLNIDLKD